MRWIVEMRLLHTIQPWTAVKPSSCQNSTKPVKQHCLLQAFWHSSKPSNSFDKAISALRVHFLIRKWHCQSYCLACYNVKKLYKKNSNVATVPFWHKLKSSPLDGTHLIFQCKYTGLEEVGDLEKSNAISGAPNMVLSFFGINKTTTNWG